MRIPKRIHLIYKTPRIPEKYQPYFECMKKFHPSWDIRVYGDEESGSIIAENMPELTAVYNNYLLDVQRTDVFRLAIVYLYGGFYMDLDMLCLEKLDQLCAHHVVLGEEKTMTDEECVTFATPHHLRIANYMFGSVPRHPFWLDVIKEAVARSGMTIRKAMDVLDSTGPGMLTDVYHDVKQRYDDVTVLLNKDKKCMKWCETISCHFGEFAAHFHYGTWHAFFRHAR
jgi:mannosyltransferase OCH1-like enzyme